MILDFLKDPLAKEITDLDDPSTFDIHRRIIESKPYLQEIYRRFYEKLMAPFGDKDLNQLKIVEIGSGAYSVKRNYPTVIATDLFPSEHVDMAVNAHEFPFEDNELDGVVLLHTLHHIPKPELFLNEVNRCLKPGGYLTMIEPYPSPWGHFVYKHLHHEPLYKIESWDIPEEEKGRLSAANCLTPYHIFFRDRARFEEKYPDLKIDSIKLHNCFVYMTSGGLSFRSLVPTFLTPVMYGLEWLLTPLCPLFAQSMTITVRKSY